MSGLSKAELFAEAIQLPSRVQHREDLNLLLEKMVSMGGSDIFIRAFDFVIVRHQGKLKRITNRTISDKEALDLLVSFYGTAAQTKLGMPEPIDVSLVYKRENEEGKQESRRFRVNAANKVHNGRLCLSMTIRALAAEPPQAADLNIPQEILDLIHNSTKGLFMMVGSTGSGKTTSLAAMIRYVLEQPDSYRKMITIESPVEYTYHSIKSDTCIIDQFQVGQSYASFYEGMRSALRQDPDDIILGEARDAETISIAAEAANTGHFVMATLHSNSIADALPRMISEIPEHQQHSVKNNLINAMRGMVCQILVIGTDGKRVPIREWLIFNDKIKDEISNADNLARKLRSMVFKFGMPMFKQAEALYASGRISERELEKVRLNFGDGSELED